MLIAPDPWQLPLHLSRDVGAVISIGYQALPEVVAELLSYYRYADVKKLMKTTSKPRTYIYYDGRLHVGGAPKPYAGLIDLGVEALPESYEEVEKPATSLEEPRELRVEGELGPSGGAAPGP